MSGSVTAGCCSCGPTRARRRRWCSTRTTEPLPLFKGACQHKHLRQHEDCGGDDLRRQGSPLQSPLPADVQSYLVDPVACTPASRLGERSGREPGRFGPRALLHAAAAVQDLDELNAWLLDRIAYAKVHHHPELTEQTIWEVFEMDDRSSFLMPAGSMDSTQCRRRSRRPVWCASTTTNTRWRPALSRVRSRSMPTPTASRDCQDGRIVAEHSDHSAVATIYDPWHYVPVLAHKPGALRNGAPFKDWVLPASMERVRRKLASADDGNRQMVDILTAVLTDRLPAVEAACAQAIAHSVHSADVVLNILARQRDPGPPGRSPSSHAGRADVAPCTDRRLCPLRQPQENQLMERTQLFDLMGELKLYGMKAAFDEIMARLHKRQHEPQRIVGDLLNAEINEKQALDRSTSSPSPSCRSPRISATSSSRRRSMRLGERSRRRWVSSPSSATPY